MPPSPPQHPGQSAPHSGWNVPEKHSWIKAVQTSNIKNQLLIIIDPWVVTVNDGETTSGRGRVTRCFTLCVTAQHFHPLTYILKQCHIFWLTVIFMLSHAFLCVSCVWCHLRTQKSMQVALLPACKIGSYHKHTSRFRQNMIKTTTKTKKWSSKKTPRN